MLSLPHWLDLCFLSPLRRARWLLLALGVCPSWSSLVCSVVWLARNAGVAVSRDRSARVRYIAIEALCLVGLFELDAEMEFRVPQL